MSNYSKQWDSETPGYIIFLVDQSRSMNEPYPVNERKDVFTSTVINRTIKRLIDINKAGKVIKNRAKISLIGYGGNGDDSVDEIRSDFLSSFAENPLGIKDGKQKTYDGNGDMIEVDVKIPIFIEPTAKGLTPMGPALEYAKQLIESWLSEYPNNPAPIIINISDGMPYDSRDNSDRAEQDAINAATSIMNLSCIDGNPLIFNAHIGNGSEKCICSASESELPDEQAKFLFKISSKIPQSYQAYAREEGLETSTNSRGFVSNADPETFTKFIYFGVTGATNGDDRSN